MFERKRRLLEIEEMIERSRDFNLGVELRKELLSVKGCEEEIKRFLPC